VEHHPQVLFKLRGNFRQPSLCPAALDIRPAKDPIKLFPNDDGTWTSIQKIRCSKHIAKQLRLYYFPAIGTLDSIQIELPSRYMPPRN